MAKAANGNSSPDQGLSRAQENSPWSGADSTTVTSRSRGAAA